MVNNIDVIDAIIGLLYNSKVKTSISGEIGTERPIDSEKEDITVNVLPLTFEQLQYCVANVNIHVKNLSVTQGGKVNTSYENRPRLKELANLVYEALHDKLSSGMYLSVLNSQLLKESKSSFMNIRVEIRAKNLN